jgi:hypothetical protein
MYQRLSDWRHQRSLKCLLSASPLLVLHLSTTISKSYMLITIPWLPGFNFSLDSHNLFLRFKQFLTSLLTKMSYRSWEGRAMYDDLIRDGIKIHQEIQSIQNVHGAHYFVLWHRHFDIRTFYFSLEVNTLKRSRWHYTV